MIDSRKQADRKSRTLMFFCDLPVSMMSSPDSEREDINAFIKDRIGRASPGYDHINAVSATTKLGYYRNSTLIYLVLAGKADLRVFRFTDVKLLPYPGHPVPIPAYPCQHAQTVG